MTGLHGWLADALLVVHAAFAGFIVIGLLAVWIGRFAGWGFVRNRALRIAHIAAMLVVLAQAALGRICPLTIWEDALRRSAGEGPRYEQSWVAHWVGRLLYYDVDMKLLAWLYAFFLMLMVVTWFAVRPEARR